VRRLYEKKNFICSYCVFICSTIPHVEAIHNQYKDKDVVVIGINMDVASKRQAVMDFIKENGMTYFIVSDANGNVASLYGATSIPRFFLWIRVEILLLQKLGIFQIWKNLSQVKLINF